MLYIFKSNASSDVIMLEASGRQLLEIMGKSADAKGILLPEQMAAAKAAIEVALALEEQASESEDAPEDQAKPKANPRISLRSRAWPLVMMIERSLKENQPMTWGV